MNGNRLVLVILVAVLAGLQYALWLGPGNLVETWRMHQAVEAQRAENERLAARNAALAAEVVDLKEGLEAVEERARSELGMVKPGEVFYQVVEQPGGQ